jgi:hypothetical protein
MTARLYLWARVGAGSWAAVRPGLLTFADEKEAEPVAARYRLAYPRLDFKAGITPPTGADHDTG